MRRPWRHARGYHEWPSSTPVIDAVRAIVAVASVVIGAHAGILLAIAVRDHDGGAAVEIAWFFVAIAIANVLVDALRHWRRHHG